jgi:menaquinone-dependent protoporphyrinogen oxidase
MDGRVLVAYATKYGAPAEIAEKIGEVIRETGLPVDVLPVDRVSDITPYRVVVLDSAVYAGQWRKEAAMFLETNEKTLAGR